MERLGSDTGRKKPEFAMVFRYFASIYIFLHLKFFCCSYLDIRRSLLVLIHILLLHQLLIMLEQKLLW